MNISVRPDFAGGRFIIIDEGDVPTVGAAPLSSTYFYQKWRKTIPHATQSTACYDPYGADIMTFSAGGGTRSVVARAWNSQMTECLWMSDLSSTPEFGPDLHLVPNELGDVFAIFLSDAVEIFFIGYEEKSTLFGPVQYDGRIRHIAFCPSGGKIVVALWTDRLWIQRFSHDEAPVTTQILAIPNDFHNMEAFAIHGDAIIVTGHKGAILVWKRRGDEDGEATSATEPDFHPRPDSFPTVRPGEKIDVINHVWYDAERHLLVGTCTMVGQQWANVIFTNPDNGHIVMMSAPLVGVSVVNLLCYARNDLLMIRCTDSIIVYDLCALQVVQDIENIPLGTLNRVSINRDASKFIILTNGNATNGSVLTEMVRTRGTHRIMPQMAPPGWCAITSLSLNGSLLIMADQTDEGEKTDTVFICLFISW